MFESVEIGHSLTKQEFEAAEETLRTALLDLQHDMIERKDFAVAVLINGVDAAGKGETVKQLNAWMDARHIDTHAFDAPTEEELERAHMWRYWHAMPPKGRIAILFNNWYTEPVSERVRGDCDDADLDRRLNSIMSFETMLVNEGVLLIKLWFHITKDLQKRRFKELESEPLTRWRVTKRDWKRLELYEVFRNVAAHVLRRTSRGQTQWHIIDGSDARWRAICVGDILRSALARRLAESSVPSAPHTGLEVPAVPQLDGRANVISVLQLDQPFEKDEYKRELPVLQERFARLVRHPNFARHSLVLAFEGNDAAGKGGAIQRVTDALDPRRYITVPISAPTDEELARPYLWRFWRRMPRNGKVVIFDRSWYGRVLVERIEGFASEADWMRAYAEINDFEEELVRSNDIVLKFWLAISADEQLERFKAREAEPHKRHKITAEDWRNRDKWDQYERAVCEMIDRTSTELAPWTIVEANNKYYARIKVLRTIVSRLEQALAKD